MRSADAELFGELGGGLPGELVHLDGGNGGASNFKCSGRAFAVESIGALSERCCRKRRIPITIINGDFECGGLLVRAGNGHRDALPQQFGRYLRQPGGIREWPVGIFGHENSHVPLG